MLRTFMPGNGEEIRPDVLVPYSAADDKRELSNSSIFVISVRPESNKVNYEAAIIKAVSPHANAVYLANLSGSLVNDKAIIACHYSSQLQFAINGKAEMSKYPEMVRAFEEKFNVDFPVANIIGSFDAIVDYKIKENAEELFSTMVPYENFLDIYGQTIKKIDDFFVLNYDIPAVITRHHEDTNIFIIALRLKDNSARFADLHHLIYDSISNNESTAILGPKERQNLPLEWYNRIRRTYHISRSHIEAMFDLTDYVFKDNTRRIGFADTPLGQRLLDLGIIPPDQLEKRLSLLKDKPLVYLDQEDGTMKLVDIILEGKTKQGDTFIESNLDECAHIIGKINWKKLESLE
ncbi:MAG: hypothetical protein GY940_03875 [bacterium]|nr:hypothetical protein [bacterium]